MELAGEIREEVDNGERPAFHLSLASPVFPGITFILRDSCIGLDGMCGGLRPEFSIQFSTLAFIIDHIFSFPNLSFIVNKL